MTEMITGGDLAAKRPVLPAEKSLAVHRGMTNGIALVKMLAVLSLGFTCRQNVSVAQLDRASPS